MKVQCSEFAVMTSWCRKSLYALKGFHQCSSDPSLPIRIPSCENNILLVQLPNPMAKSKPIGLKWRSSTLFIVSTVGIGLFTDLFLYGLVVPILPFILQDRVNLPQDKIQSHVSGLLAAYAGASVLFSPLAGILADKLSTRQLPFLVGLTALLLATLLLLLGQNVAVLTVARILQGISAAVVWTIGLALVLDTVGPENLGKTIGSVRLWLCHYKLSLTARVRSLDSSRLANSQPLFWEVSFTNRQDTEVSFYLISRSLWNCYLNEQSTQLRKNDLLFGPMLR